SVRYHEPAIDMIANVTGKRAGAEVAEPAYWVRHVMEPVRFAAGMASLASLGPDVYLEAGPQPTLLGLGRQCVPEGDAAWLPSLRRKRGDWQQMLESVASLFVPRA